MNKLILSIFTVFCITFTSSAQDSKTKAPHSIGLHAGAISGLGFSYRYWPSKLGVQITTIPIFRKNGNHFFSAGLSALYTLNEGEKVDLYGYLGNHILSTSKNPNVIYNVGVGFGFKINFLESMDFNMQAGYGMYDLTNQFFTSLTGELGLYYHF